MKCWFMKVLKIIHTFSTKTNDFKLLSIYILHSNNQKPVN